MKIGTRPISCTAPICHERLYEVLPPLESFSRRHIGPSPEFIQEMLQACGVEVGLYEEVAFIYL